LDVDYAAHVYSRLTASNMDHGQRVTVSSWLPLQTSGDPAVAFRQALKRHIINVVGHRVLDGRDTILLRVSDNVRNACSSPARITAAPASRSGLALTWWLRPGVGGQPARPAPDQGWIWVDARNYLVVQTEPFMYAYKGGSSITRTSKVMCVALDVDHVTWLTPSPQNLALLTLSPPAGFTNVPYSAMASYLGYHGPTS
jgi:hypothetical protein